MPRFTIAAAAAGMAQYLSQTHGGPLKAHSGPLVDRSHLYWPGLQGLVNNPMAWRERLAGQSEFNLFIFHLCCFKFDLFFFFNFIKFYSKTIIDEWLICRHFIKWMVYFTVE